MEYTLTAQMSGQKLTGWHSSQQLPTISIVAHSPREAVAKLVQLLGSCGDRDGLLIKYPRTLAVSVLSNIDEYDTVKAEWQAGSLTASITVGH